MGKGWDGARRRARHPNPERVPSPAEIKRALANSGLCRGRAGGGWLVTRSGSCGEMVIMVMQLGDEQRAGEPKRPPKGENGDD